MIMLDCPECWYSYVAETPIEPCPRCLASKELLFKTLVQTASAKHLERQELPPSPRRAFQPVQPMSPHSPINPCLPFIPYQAHRRVKKFEKTPEGRFICPTCGNLYAHESSASRHVRLDHEQAGFHCSVCQQQFPNPTRLTNHMRNHTGAPSPYKCSCGKTYSRSDHLGKHIYAKLKMPDDLSHGKV